MTKQMNFMIVYKIYQILPGTIYIVAGIFATIAKRLEIFKQGKLGYRELPPRHLVHYYFLISRDYLYKISEQTRTL